MLKRILFGTLAVLFLSLPAMARSDQGTPSSPPAQTDQHTVNCSTMEPIVANWPGASVVIFHPSDKSDWKKLSELLKKYAGQEVQFETGDGKQHCATVARLKTCFGRGVLIFASDEATLGVKEEFILRFGNHL